MEVDQEEEIIQIDEVNAEVPAEVVEYSVEIFQNMKQIEKEYLPTDYMVVQKDISPPMRAILNDWLIEVSQEFKLSSETLFLAVNFVDRFLCAKIVARAKLQLLGVVCMLISAYVFSPLFICFSANLKKFTRLLLMILYT